MPIQIAEAWRRTRNRRLKYARRLRKKIGRRVTLPRLWLRYEDEAAACPACASAELTVLDVQRVRSDLTGRRLTFLTGCETCGLIFTNPLPHSERIATFYGEEGVWGEAHAARAAHLAAAHERRKGRPKPARSRGKRGILLDAMQPHVPIDTPPPGAKVIDFGCGEGKLLNTLQEAGWDTYGIEPSSDVAFLRHKRLDTPPTTADFDFAIMHHVLEHVPNPLGVLRQLAGSLREGGMLFISVPRFDTIARHRDFRYCINGRNHVVAFTEDCLASLLVRAGFEVAARLHAPELDAAFTDGQPLRLRLLARRTLAPPAPPRVPLAAARRALAEYARAHVPLVERLRAAIPARLRGGWMEWTLER